MIAFFVTATDTNVGKTFVSKGLAEAFCKEGKNVGYFKPLQSGVVENEPTDAQIVQSACPGVKIKNSYITKTPAAPSLSAQIEGVQIDLNKIKEDFENFKTSKDVVKDVIIVEGSGGLFVPVTEVHLMSDVIKILDIPVLVVARPDLGTVNHTLMTLKCIEDLGAEILGVVISNYDKGSNDPSVLNARNMIETHSKHRVLAQISKNAALEEFSALIHHFPEVAVRQQERA